MKSTKYFGNTASTMLGVILFSILVLVGASRAFSQPAKAIEWKMQSLYPVSDCVTPCFLDKITKAVNERLKDKLRITVFYVDQIVPGNQMFDALKRGVYDVAFMAPTWYQNFMPDFIVGFGLPLGWEGYDMNMEFFYKYGFLKYARDIHAEQNVYYVAPMPIGSIVLFGNVPFRKLEDLKGKKIWAAGPIASFMNHMGASVVMFPHSDVFMAAQLGTIDGAVFTLGVIKPGGYAEVTKYMTVIPGFSSINAALLVNLKSWNNTPRDVQKAFEDIITDLQPEFHKCMDSISQEGIDEVKKHGGQIATVEPAEIPKLRPAAMKVWEEYAAKSARAPKTFQYLKDFLKTKGIEVE